MSRSHTFFSPFFIVVALIFISACSQTPAPVLNEEKMAHLLVDLQLADAQATEQRIHKFDTDSIRRELRESVLAKHHINEATLDTSLHWYGAHLPQLIKVYERADSMLADSLRAIDNEELMAKSFAAGDSTELWALAPSIVMEGSDFFAFTIPADTTWKRGDVFEWQFTIHNLRREPVNVVFGANYEDRGQTVNAQEINRDNRDRNHYSLLMQLDRQKSAGRLFGYIQIPLDSGRRVFIDSITLTRTRLIDSEYNSRRYRLRTLGRSKPL